MTPIIVPALFKSTKCPLDSLVVIPSSQLKKMAEATINYILQYRKNALDELIAKERQEITLGFWHRLLKRPIPTDAEVLSQLNGGCGDGLYISEVFWIETKYWKNEQVANKLLRATSLSNEVYVSTEDLSKLF